MAMVDAFTIGMTINVKGEANKQIADLGKVVEATNQKINLLNKAILKLNESFTATSAILDRVIPRLAEFSDSFSVSMKSANAELSSFNSKLKETAVLSRGGRKGGGGMGGGGAMGAAGGVLSYFGGGAFAAMLGGGFLLKDSFQANSHFENAYAQFVAQGYGAQADAQARAMAMGMNIPGVSNTQLMTAIGESSTITRNADQAMALAPYVSKMSFANKSIFSRDGKDFTRQDEMNLIRSAELASGSTQLDKILPKLNLIEKAYTTEAGNLSSGDLLSFAKRAASILPQLDTEALFRFIPLIQAIGGGTAGFGARLFQSNMLRGQAMTTGKKAMKRLAGLGLFKNGKVIDPDLLTKDPILWAENELFPALTKGGYKTDAQKSQEIKRDFSGTSSAFLIQILEMMSKINQSAKMGQQAQGIQGAYGSALNLPSGKIQQLGASWNNLMTSFGKMTASPVLRALDGMTRILNGLTKMVGVINDISSGDDKKGFSRIGHFAERHASGAAKGMISKSLNTIVPGAGTASDLAFVQLNMDGKKVGDGIIKYFSKLFDSAPSSGSSITPQLNFMPTSFNYTG